LSELLLSTARLHYISEQVLSSHSIVSLSRTIRPCSLWGGRWIGLWKTCSSVCFSGPHSQAAKKTTPHLCNQEWKLLTLVWRPLGWTHTVLRKAIPGGWVLRLKVQSLLGLSNQSAFHRCILSTHCAACMLLMKLWGVLQIDVSILNAMHSHLVDRWMLSGTGV